MDTHNTPRNPVPAASLPLLLTVEETAHQLGLSRASVARLLQNQRLRKVKAGRATRITRTSVEALVAALEAGEALVIRKRSAAERKRAAELHAERLRTGDASTLGG